jgi:hypothetical protein
LKSRLKKAPNRFYSKEDLEMASQFVSDALNDTFEMNCPVKLKNTSTRVPWWNKQLAKLRAEVRRLFNRARNLGKEGDWERFRETQRAYKKAIVGEDSVKALRRSLRHPGFTGFSAKKIKHTWVALSFPLGTILSRWRSLWDT